MLVAFQACREGEIDTADSQIYLTVSVDPTYGAFDKWLFTTDESGKILETHKVFAGSTIAFKNVSAPKLVNLTVFYSVGGQHSFTTYGALERGTRLTLNLGSRHMLFGSGFDKVVGKAIIRIDNSTPYASFGISDGSSYSQFSDSAAGAVEVPFPLNAIQSDILITSFKSGVPVYQWLNDAGVDEHYAVDFNSFVAFPNTVSFALQGDMYASIHTYKAGSNRIGYTMASEQYFGLPDAQQRAALGYLQVDNYDSYILLVGRRGKINANNSYTYYRKIGTTLPAEVTLEHEQSFSVRIKSFNEFDFDYSSNYSYRTHYWSNYKTDHNLTWDVHTSDYITPRIPELPLELKLAYPSISVKELSLQESSFVTFKDGYTYAKFVEDRINGNRPTNREQLAHVYLTN